MHYDFNRHAGLLLVKKPVVKVHDVADRLGFKRGQQGIIGCAVEE